MRVIVQRVTQASVHCQNKFISNIGVGYVLLVGLKENDTLKEVEYVARKIAKLRVFSDSDDKMNLSIDQVNGDILSISQFTLYGDTSKSNRPSFTEAMAFEKANQLYEAFNQILRDEYGLTVLTGKFGEDMQVSLINDGPVTIMIEKNNG